MSTVQEQPKNEALLSLRDTGPNSLVERADHFIISMESIVADSEALVPAANDFNITTEAEFQFADEMRVELIAQAKSLDAQRMVITRPVEDLKKYLMSVVSPAITNNNAAAAIYNRKALAYRAEQRAMAEAARLKAEAEQRATQARLEAEARKKDEHANKLKTAAAQQKAREEADALRQAAAFTPVTMAVSAPAPQATASNVVDKWEAEVVKPSEFLRWLADHPEWQNVVSFTKSGLNKIAGQYKDTLPVPGVTITSSEAFRKKAAR